MFISIKYTAILSLLCVLFTFGSDAIASKASTTENNLNSGYSVLQIFLEDEQHLTTIRRIKAIISFSGISEITEKLIDDIADLSSTSLDELELLMVLKPAISLVKFSDDGIGKATLNSMRITTAKEFIFDTENFEKNLLISQAQILRVISHLAATIAENESTEKRKVWLNKLAKQYQDLYVLVHERIAHKHLSFFLQYSYDYS